MGFHGQVTAAKWIDRFKPERTTVFEGYFDAPSIQAAKAHLTRLANKTELFSYVQSWDNEKRVYTGKDLRWRPWSDRMDYTKEMKKCRFCHRIDNIETFMDSTCSSQECQAQLHKSYSEEAFLEFCEREGTDPEDWDEFFEE